MAQEVQKIQSFVWAGFTKNQIDSSSLAPFQLDQFPKQWQIVEGSMIFTIRAFMVGETVVGIGVLLVDPIIVTPGFTSKPVHPQLFSKEYIEGCEKNIRAMLASVGHTVKEKASLGIFHTVISPAEQR